MQKERRLEMWANAQRDGRPAEYRWRPLLNAAVWLTPTTTRVPCSNAAKTRDPLKLPGVPQTNETISAASRPNLPYCTDMWGRHCCLISFFRLSIRALDAKIWLDKVVRWCPDGEFLGPAFPAIHVQHISDLHSKFALGPHHM